LSLTGGIERWLYRVVRKHGGHQSGGWAFTMAQLHHKSGSTQRLADFAKELRRTVERQRLPGYWLQFLRNSLPVLKGLAVGSVGHSAANRKNLSFG